MRISIDNLDGLGALDYSGWISTSGALKIQRTLNKPSTCECRLDLSASTLRMPVRRARVVVTLDNGSVLFMEYIAKTPEFLYTGVGTTGSQYGLGVQAISDEWLLDRQGATVGNAGLQQNGVNALGALTSRVGLSGFTTAGTGPIRSVGVFVPEQAATWSGNAGALADSVYAAYRVLGGAVGLQTAGTVTHIFSDGDGSLRPGGLQLAQTRELANDVTLSGELEPAAYVAENFASDGATNVFTLTKAPFRHGSGRTSAQLLSDSFSDGVLNGRVWSATDPGSHLSFTAAGLTSSGGNGLDGQTTIEALDALEMGGALVLEMGAVKLEPGSDGVLCGLYNGGIGRANYFAGYNVRQSNGSMVLVPLVNGVETGMVYTVQEGHRYVLRMRVHSVEVQRVRQIYYAMSGGALKSFGGGVVPSSVDLVFDLQDMGASSNTPATVLYDGTVANAAGSCTFAPLNSIQLIGSVGYCRATQTGSAWVTKITTSGTKTTQLMGVAGEGVDCMASASGKITFLAGRVPLSGELVTVHYRTSQRSIVRLEDAASVAMEALGGVAGTARWLGKVVQPPARSTADCESAAEALLSVATDATGGVSGSYTAEQSAEIWPGDVLSVTQGGGTTNSIVKGVTIQDGLAAPEIVTYHVTFAGEWAAGLGLKTSETIAADAVLPQTAQTGPGMFLDNLQQVALVSASGSALQIDAGVAPPTGGGFEVRRRDGGFGVGVDQDLVLRSPVRAFSIPREAQVEQYYVRMYDGSMPPVYSRFSSAVFTDIPVG